MNIIFLIFALFFSIYCSTCGNGIVEEDEECDDGNLRNGDGCSNECMIERNYHGWPMYLCSSGDPSICQFKVPVGIPRPLYGITQSRFMYEGLPGYFDDGNGPYTHYVDNSDSSCSDSSTSENLVSPSTITNKGTPEIPRCTIPLNLEPGNVVEINGGSYSYTGYAGDKTGIVGTGNSTHPIIITGNPDNIPIFNDLKIRIVGNYILVENIKFSILDAGNIQSAGNYTIFRSNEIYGDDSRNWGGALSMIGWYNLAWKNHIHNIGRYNDENENDFHGITFPPDSHFFWVLDNKISHMGGDCVGNGHSNSRTTTHFFISRNSFSSGGENAIDTKEVTDFIFSENEMFDWQGYGSGSSGTAIVAHYGSHSTEYTSKNIWFINNRIWNCKDYATSTSGGADEIYFIGNTITDAKLAFSSWSSERIYVVGNSVKDVSSFGLSYEGTSETSRAVIVNNVFSEVSSGRGIELDYTAYRNRAILSSNVFYNKDESNPVIWDGSCNGNCVNDEDPKFMDENENNDLHLTSESTVLIGKANSSVAEEYVYQRFEDYFLSVFTDLGSPEQANIRFDIDDKCFGGDGGDSTYDIGAYQYEADSNNCDYTAPPIPIPPPPSPDPSPDPDIQDDFAIRCGVMFGLVIQLVVIIIL